MKFYGQQGEDMIAWELFKSSPLGFFVDVGAYDGIASSNSLAFEQRGWHGVCFEPNPYLFRRLLANRKCALMDRVVGERMSDAEPFEINEPAADGNVSGCSKRSINPNASRLPLITLDYALSFLGVDHVDYVSIDVEGWERQVLLGFDIAKYEPRLVIVENNGDAKVAEYFESNGYVLGRQHYFNTFYLRDKSDIGTVVSISTNMENGRLMS